MTAGSTWCFPVSSSLLLWVLCSTVVAHRVTVECETRPYFRCPDCLEELLAEQLRVRQAILERFPKAVVVDTTYKLLNAMFIANLPEASPQNSLNAALKAIPGVLHVYPSEDLVSLEDGGNEGEETADYIHSEPLVSIGADVAALDYCLSGENVKVAILDTGIDYTHAAMGGSGTVEAFQQAFGDGIEDERNTRRDNIFPTERVVDGYDFIGDMYRIGDPDFNTMPDHDPVDLAGHGTAVAHAVRAVAPGAQLVAVKICSTEGSSTCPDFAFVRGLEYILDPNQDGNLDDKVDIVNVSLGSMYSSSYYSALAKATEEVFALGVLVVLSAGNQGNLPFVLGGAPASPNALTVGATVVDYPYSSINNRTATATTTARRQPCMSSYSARGPGSDSNILKPDLVAPGGPYWLAEASTGNRYRRFIGTSFAAPLVAGCAALLKEKCPECSPFAIKALLMNHANHGVRYGWSKSSTAPVTLQGAGQVQIQKSLAATFWAYSEQDVNPSLSLGLVNAASSLVLKRRIRIVKLTDNTETLAVSYELRSQQHADALSVRFIPDRLIMEGHCQEVFHIDVEFHIDASYAPSNHQFGAGAAGSDATTLDWNEVDGWIELSSTTPAGNEVALPFHMILRKASNVTAGMTFYNASALDIEQLPASLPVDLHNHGAETAQIDAFELIAISQDDAEENYGIDNPPADFRFVGYRIVHLNHTDCRSMLEIAIHTWEAQRSLAFTHFYTWFDLDFDGVPEFSIVNGGFRLGNPRTDMRLIDFADPETLQCTGYTPDHETNTANSVLRICTNDLGLEAGGDVNIKVTSMTFPEEKKISDTVGWQRLSLTEAALIAPSYDLKPGATLSALTVSGTGITSEGRMPLGLMLFTNSFRSTLQTGAATVDSEVLVIVRNGVVLPTESSPDILDFPAAENFAGPDCLWAVTKVALSKCPRRRKLLRSFHRNHAEIFSSDDASVARHLQTSPSCPEIETPRIEAIVVETLLESLQTAPPATFVTGT